MSKGGLGQGGFHLLKLHQQFIVWKEILTDSGPLDNPVTKITIILIVIFLWKNTSKLLHKIYNYVIIIIDESVCKIN